MFLFMHLLSFLCPWAMTFCVYHVTEWIGCSARLGKVVMSSQQCLPRQVLASCAAICGPVFGHAGGILFYCCGGLRDRSICRKSLCHQAWLCHRWEPGMVTYFLSWIYKAENKDRKHKSGRFGVHWRKVLVSFTSFYWLDFTFCFS